MPKPEPFPVFSFGLSAFFQKKIRTKWKNNVYIIFHIFPGLRLFLWRRRYFPEQFFFLTPFFFHGAPYSPACRKTWGKRKNTSDKNGQEALRRFSATFMKNSRVFSSCFDFTVHYSASNDSD